MVGKTSPVWANVPYASHQHYAEDCNLYESTVGFNPRGCHSPLYCRVMTSKQLLVINPFILCTSRQITSEEHATVITPFKPMARIERHCTMNQHFLPRKTSS